MLPLIPLAITLVPSLTKWLFGPTAAATAQEVGDVMQTLTGSKDPAGIKAALTTNPELTNDLTIHLAQIAADREHEADQQRQAELLARLGDMASARSQTITLASARSPIAWGAPVISGVVLITFGAMLAVILARAIPPGSESLSQIMLGTLASMATAVVQYWVGSSAGSAAKSNDLRVAQDQLAHSTPIR